MADDFQVTNTADFLKLSKALKEAGHLELRKQLNKGIREAVKPLTPKTRAATSRLPQRGGLAARVAKTPQRVQVRTGAQTAGVRLVVGASNSGARGANKGVVRHPVFNTGEWAEQKVPPGWFDEPTQAAKPEITKAVQSAMQKVADDVVRGVK